MTVSLSAHPDEGDRDRAPVGRAAARSSSAAEPAGELERLRALLHNETRHLFRVRLGLTRLVNGFLPLHVGNRARVALLRAAGFSIGRGTVMWGLPQITGDGRVEKLLTIGSLCRFNVGCVFDVNAAITIDDLVGCGHEVMFLTTTHEIGGEGRRSGPPVARPITVGRACWLGARAMILSGVTIGDASVVAAGAVVTKDVPPNTMVAGVPARPIRQLT
jgi:maltose O-acetyltransferase